jgi:CO/xanthine dehydrogenase Mo-binding subunit
MNRYEVIGKSVPRVEGVEKVTGAAKYTGDVSLPGMLWGKTLLSHLPHARIVRIDISEAEKVPGVRAVLTGADVGAFLYGRALKDIPALARDKVRHAGERVVAVAADDRDAAQRAVELIEVEYEALPAVFDPVEAAAPGAPIIHPGFNDYPGVRRPLSEPSNAFVHAAFAKGDIEKGFAEADVVSEHTYYTQDRHAVYLEPQGVIVWDDQASGRVRIWVSNSKPFRLKVAIPRTFEVPEEKIVFHPTFVGGDFGAKSLPANMAIAYFLSRAAGGRPVKMLHDYTEELLAGNPNKAMVYRMKTGVKRDGTLTALQVQHFVSCGAYAGYTPGGGLGGANAAGGPYRVPNVKFESANVYTNTLPAQIMRAPGEPQAVFALESHMDEVAREIGMDPVEFRMKNLVETGEPWAAGEEMEDVRIKETLQATIAAAGYRTPKPPNVGRGVAIGDRAQGGGQAHAAVTLKPDGSIVVGAPIFDPGTGVFTTLCQVVAEELQVPVDEVRFEVWDTDSVPYDDGVGGSKQSRMASTVAYNASQDAKTKLLALVARHFDWPEDSLSLRGPEIWRADIEEKVNWRDLLRDTGETISGRSSVHEAARSRVTSFAVQVAEVSVDPETGEVKLLNFTTGHDVGTILNETGHQGQINGGVMQGIGLALTEELKLEDGRVTNASLGDYKVPTIGDIPPMRTVLVRGERGNGPYNVKGIGELPIVPVSPAVMNAIEDAVGVRIRALPATAEKVYRALRGGDPP